MNIYVVRHGQTNWNLQNRLQGSTDIALNEYGKKEANELLKSIKNVKVDIIISSTLKRARETADILNYYNQEIILEKGLEERHFGSFEGKKSPQIDEFWNYNKNLSCYGVEGIRDFFYRVFSTMDKIMEDYKGKDILIITHACVMIAIDCYFRGFKPDYNLRNYCFKNCKYVYYNI